MSASAPSAYKILYSKMQLCPTNSAPSFSHAKAKRRSFDSSKGNSVIRVRGGITSRYHTSETNTEIGREREREREKKREEKERVYV